MSTTVFALYMYMSRHECLCGHGNNPDDGTSYRSKCVVGKSLARQNSSHGSLWLNGSLECDGSWNLKGVDAR